MTPKQQQEARALAEEHRERAVDLRVETAGMAGPLRGLKARILDRAKLHERTARMLDKLSERVTA